MFRNYCKMMDFQVTLKFLSFVNSSHILNIVLMLLFYFLLLNIVIVQTFKSNFQVKYFPVNLLCLFDKKVCLSVIVIFSVFLYFINKKHKFSFCQKYIENINVGTYISLKNKILSNADTL